MIPLCVPDPHLRVETATPVSTVGVLCRDLEGVLGATASFHGTGPVGTGVSVNTYKTTVKAADPIQDIVFLPLGEGFPLPRLMGSSGIRGERSPAQADKVIFEGATSGRVTTRIMSHDAGLLRRRKTVQLKVQTPPDTNVGDSGCALVDDTGKVLAFAFERSAYGEYPELTDWIWADNAMASLGLHPIGSGVVAIEVNPSR